MKDITTRRDVEHLIDKFYSIVLTDAIIGHFFTEVVRLDTTKHIPIMYDFWTSILFGSGNYNGNPIAKHIHLNQKSQLTSVHFDRWLRLWEVTVHQLYAGPKATIAVKRANSIAKIMKLKVASYSTN